MADLFDPDEFEDFTQRTTAQWRDRDLDGLVARRAELASRAETLKGYQHRSQPQENEYQQATAEVVVLDGLIGKKHTAVRSEKLRQIQRAAADPANREAGVAHSLGGDRPADAQAIWRNRQPWQGLDEVAMRSESIGRGPRHARRRQR